MPFFLKVYGSPDITLFFFFINIQDTQVILWWILVSFSNFKISINLLNEVERDLNQVSFQFLFELVQIPLIIVLSVSFSYFVVIHQIWISKAV